MLHSSLPEIWGAVKEREQKTTPIIDDTLKYKSYENKTEVPLQ